MTLRDWMAWYWPAMLVSWILMFAIPEAIALLHGGMTLSEWVWRATKAWPPLPFVGGLLAGGLAVHFWWQNEGLGTSTIKSIFKSIHGG